MELFAKLFDSLLILYTTASIASSSTAISAGLSLPNRWCISCVLGIPVVSKEVLSQRTHDYCNWVEAYARNHKIPIE